MPRCNEPRAETASLKGELERETDLKVRNQDTISSRKSQELRESLWNQPCRKGHIKHMYCITIAKMSEQVKWQGIHSFFFGKMLVKND